LPPQEHQEFPMVTSRQNLSSEAGLEEIFREPLLISVDELAMILKISPRSVWRLLSAGKMIEPVRIGGAVRWRFHEVKSWIDQGCPTVNGGRK
jgi:predicted DNA-binding transcriptional regulator AlpA